MSRLESFERLARNVPKKFWKGTDILLMEDVILEPSSGYEDWMPVSIKVTRDNLPPLEGLFRDDLSLLSGSLRSRLAQSGVDLHELPGNILAQGIRQTAYTGFYAEHPINFHEGAALNFPDLSALCYANGYRDLVEIFNEPVNDVAFVANRSARPVRLDKGMGLFRFFTPLAPAVCGKGLVSLIEDGEICIDGEKGIDWDVARNRSGLETGVMVRIEPQSERWISDGDDVVYVSDTEQNYRSILSAMMAPLPDDRQVLCIGETPRTKLSDRVEGVIYKATSPNITGQGWLSGVNIHTNSHLIDAGSDWRIRTEVLGKKDTPRHIFYRYYLND